MEESKIYRRERGLEVCGVVGVCPTTREEFIEEVFSMPTTPVSGTVDLVGMPAIVSAKENPEYAQMYNQASFTAIDGMPIVKMARRKGFVCDRCAAPDIMGMVFEESIKRNKTHFFYGGKNDDVLAKLRANLEKDYPGIQILGMYSPPFRPLTEEEDVAVCKQINDLQPDFVWVGIGAPKQEMWMWKHREKLHGTVMFGVGAGFDFMAGTLKKAPKWMEQASLEWLYRLMKEPKRLWRRYLLGGVKFAFYNLQSKFKR